MKNIRKVGTTENQMLESIGSFMEKFGIKEIQFGKTHSIVKPTKKSKAKSINKKK